MGTAYRTSILATILDPNLNLNLGPDPDPDLNSAPVPNFTGFARPNVGAIPPIAEMQAMWWCARLATASATKKVRHARGTVIVSMFRF